MKKVSDEISARRTFAIISHPDAGKTTLTEKLLLYAGMIQTAGMVRARKTQKTVSSDWMALEQERGISITASAMQFLYKNTVINVLDTPGHQDFSEDTYRTLTAADSAVMVIDAAKGVETQTRKLFQVCRMRGIPILTFVNKMDLPAREPLDLMSEVEDVLGIQSSPVNWPIGSGQDFVGVYDRFKKKVLLFGSKGQKGSQRVDFDTLSLEEAKSRIPERLYDQLLEEVELLEAAGTPFDRELFLSGELTPVFFGSALTNFGVEPFFDLFVDLAPEPRKRTVFRKKGEELEQTEILPDSDNFSAYVFKIQANMDLRHRDSMAFLRVCSGVFERDMQVVHERSGKKVRLSRSHNMFGGGRSTVDQAFPGDIVGVVNPGLFAIGDSVSAEGGLVFEPLPKFPPEVVARIRPKDAMKGKAFEKGVEQFRDEGAILILEPVSSYSKEPLLAAVGPLQFEVIQSRLEQEYGVKTELELLPYRHGAWLIGDPDKFQLPSSSMLARDREGNIIMLYTRDWEKNHALEMNSGYQLVEFAS